MPGTYEEGAPQVWVEAKDEDGRNAMLKNERRQQDVPGRAFGYFLKLRFGINKAVAERKSGGLATLLWIKQVLDIEGLTWKRKGGSRRRFTIHVEEFFRIKNAQEGRVTGQTRHDNHFRWWPKGAGFGYEPTAEDPCGLSVVVEGELTVGKLFRKGAGGNTPENQLQFVFDTGIARHTGDTAPPGVKDVPGTIKNVPAVRPGCGRSAKPDEFCFEALPQFPTSKYWYWWYKDTCPTLTITPSDCDEVVSKAKGGSRLRRSNDGDQSPWRAGKKPFAGTPGAGDSDSNPKSSDDPSKLVPGGGCAMPGPDPEKK